MDKQVNRILILILAAASIGAFFMKWVQMPVFQTFGITSTGGSYNAVEFISELGRLKDVGHCMVLILSYFILAAVTGIRALFGMRPDRWGLVTSIVMLVTILCIVNVKDSLNDLGKNMEMSTGYYLAWICAIGLLISSIVEMARRNRLAEKNPETVAPSVNPVLSVIIWVGCYIAIVFIGALLVFFFGSDIIERLDIPGLLFPAQGITLILGVIIATIVHYLIIQKIKSKRKPVQLADRSSSEPVSVTGEETTEEPEPGYTPKPAPEPRVLVTPPVSTSQEQPVTSQPVASAPAVKKSQPLILWVGIAMLLFAAGAAVYYIFVEPRNKTAAVDSSNRTKMYTYSGLNTNLRSSDDPNSAILAKLSYGVPLLVESQAQDWVQVKYNNTTGYISSDYLLPEDDYFLLNSIFGDAKTQECLNESRYRRALLDYFKTNRLYGDPAGRPDESPYSGFQAGWQAYTLPKGSKPNTVLFTGDKEFQDMAVIIRNKNTGKRKCLLFAFDQATKQPTLIHEEDAPATGYIQEVASQPDGTKRIIY